MGVKCYQPFLALACVVIVYVIAWWVQFDYPRGEVATITISRFICVLVIVTVTLYAMFRRVTTAKKLVWCRWKYAGQQDTYKQFEGKDMVETEDRQAPLA